MTFRSYLEDEDDKPYYHLRTLAYYYENMEGFAEKVDNAAKTLNLTKEDIEKRISAKLDEWDQNIQAFPESVTDLLQQWTVDGTIDTVIQTALIDEKLEPFAVQLAENVKKVNNKMSKSEIQNAINTYSTIEFLDGEYLIDVSGEIGFTIPSNRKIIFRPNAVLKVIPTDLARYVVIYILNVDNVEIDSPTIIGDRNEHIGTVGERGTAFEIRQSSDIKIYSPKISDCWGDGMYINNTIGKNILIEYPVIHNSRRNGISVISGTNIKIVNPLITNTNGINPQAGIDIEPNLSTDILDGIVIENPITENSVNEGITINLMQIANTAKVVDIKITNHKDTGSKHGLHVFRGVGLNGLIEIERPTYKASKGSAVWVRDCDVTNALVRIIKPTIIAEVSTDFGIRIGKETNDTYSNIPGNVEVIEPVVIDNRDIKLIHSIYVRNMISGGFVDKVNIINPRKLDGQNNLFFIGAGIVSDTYNILEHKQDYAVDVLRPDILRVTFNNELFTSRKTYNFRNTLFPVGCPELTFKVLNPIGLRIKPAIGEKIAVVSGIENKFIESDQVGASITLRKMSTNTWFPTKIIGNWTAEV